MRIAIASYRYNLSIGSMTNSLLWLLAERGNDVDIFIDRHSREYCESSLEHERIQWRVMDEQTVRRTSFERIFPKLDFLDRFIAGLPLSVRTFLFSRPLYRFSEWMKQCFHSTSYDLVIAVEARALVSAHWCTDVPIAYLNMELLGWDKDVWSFPHKQLLKTIECDLLKRVEHVFITSELRGDIFSRINNYPRENISALPVVPLRGGLPEECAFFRDKFNIPKEKKIVLYAGHITRWALCHEIIPTMREWPQDCVLVLHTWSKSIVDGEYLNDLETLAEGLPVYFSFENIPYARIAEAWASADVGLAFYDELDDNFTEILFSSNKIGECMKSGLPLICSAHPSLAAFVRENGIGCAVSTKEIPEALASILANYDGIKMNVAKCHEKYFIFEKYFDEIYPILAGMS